MGTVYGYARVSTAAQANEGESLDVQHRMLAGWAHMQGRRLDEVFVERGVSGSVPLAERPEGGRLWARLRPDDVLVASKLDRLFRSTLDALRAVEDLRTRGVSLVLLDLGGDIAGNGLSKLFLTIAAAFAEAERDRIRERVAQVKQDQRSAAATSAAGCPTATAWARTGRWSPSRTSRRSSPAAPGSCGPLASPCGPSSGS